ncbi:MAG: type I-B CRISPR-associated protein Cas5b [Candidatus Odinarchaeota archaeon]
MKVLKIAMTSPTASFKHPFFHGDLQPSLPIPPFSTIFGLLSAVRGEILTSMDQTGKFTFFFTSETAQYDLETIWKPDLTMKTSISHISNPIKREFLYNSHLTLYLTDLSWKKDFSVPYYQITLGRSQDIASIQSLDTITLQERDSGILSNCWIPKENIDRLNLVKNFILYRVPVKIETGIPRIIQESELMIYPLQPIDYSGPCWLDPLDNTTLIFPVNLDGN